MEIWHVNLGVYTQKGKLRTRAHDAVLLEHGIINHLSNDIHNS